MCMITECADTGPRAANAIQPVVLALLRAGAIGVGMTLASDGFLARLLPQPRQVTAKAGSRR